MELPDLTVFAARFTIRLDRPLSGGGLKSLVGKLMSGMALECVASGAALIGHIKCIAEVPDGSHIACSVLGNDGNAECSGEFSDGHSTVAVVQNTLLYGLPKARVKANFFKVLDREVAASGGRFEIMQ